MTPLHLKTGDMLETTGHRGPHLYHVAGVHLGATHQESIVELVPLTQMRPSDGPKTVHPLVPFHMIELGVDAGIFRITPYEEIDPDGAAEDRKGL